MYEGKYIKPVNDIYLNDVASWESWDQNNKPAHTWDVFQGLWMVTVILFRPYIQTPIMRGIQAMIKNCKNGATVIGDTSTDDNINSSTGGIVGTAMDSSISRCVNTGAVQGNQNVGGIVGKNYDSRTVSECYNAGTVDGNYRVGWIIGHLNSDSNNITVRDCYTVSVPLS